MEKSNKNNKKGNKDNKKIVLSIFIVLIMIQGVGASQIICHSPNSPVYTKPGNSVTFNVTTDGPLSIKWLLGTSQVQRNDILSISGGEADYTNIGTLVEGSYTLSAIPCIINGICNISQTQTWQWYVDGTPPWTYAWASGTLGNNGWYTSNVQISLSAIDNNGVKETRYIINNGIDTLYTNPINIANEGITTIELYSIDNTGNEEAHKSLPIKIDRTPPGDANGDGSITVADALLYLRFAVGRDISPYHIFADDDVTCDGMITAADVLKVLRKAVGQNVNLICT